MHCIDGSSPQLSSSSVSIHTWEVQIWCWCLAQWRPWWLAEDRYYDSSTVSSQYVTSILHNSSRCTVHISCIISYQHDFIRRNSAGAQWRLIMYEAEIPNVKWSKNAESDKYAKFVKGESSTLKRRSQKMLCWPVMRCSHVEESGHSMLSATGGRHKSYTSL